MKKERKEGRKEKGKKEGNKICPSKASTSSISPQIQSL
jgi:hypothetical protein